MSSLRAILLALLVVGSMLVAPVSAIDTSPREPTSTLPVTQAPSTPPQSQLSSHSTSYRPGLDPGPSSTSQAEITAKNQAAPKQTPSSQRQARPADRWNKTFGGPSAEEGNAIAQTADGGYVTAGYATQDGSQDGQLVKVASDGTKEWSHTYGGSGDQRAYDVATTAAGGYVIAGVTQPANPDAGGADMWLVKVDANGEKRWSKTYGGQQADHAYSVIATQDGGYALAGWTNSSGAGGKDAALLKVASDGTQEFFQTYGGPEDEKGQAVVQTDDGGYALAGWTTSFGAGEDDMLLVRTSSTGDQQWRKTYGGTDNDGVYRHGLTATADGGFALAGWTVSYSIGLDDMWLVKVDASGDKEWSQAYGRSLNDVATGVVQTADGGYALSGYTETYDRDEYDAWLIKTDAGGTEQWNTTVGGNNVDVATDLTLTPNGGYAMAGYTGSYGSGSYDTWVVSAGEPAGPAPTIDASSVTLSPYPVEQGATPTLTLAAANADAVKVRVSLPATGQSARVPMTTVSPERYQLDLTTIDVLDGLQPGTHVDMTVIATSDGGTTRLTKWLSGSTQTQFLRTNADLDYTVFENVKDVAVVLGSFPGQTPPDDLNGLPELLYWETSMELDANNYFGSGRGSMGAVGFNFTYLDNNEQFYELPEKESYYGNRANPDWLYDNLDDCPGDTLGYFASSKCGAHFFLEDLQDESGLNPSNYDAWIGTHPGPSLANANDNPDLDWDGNQYTGVHFDPGYGNDNAERSYFPISQFILTGLHELGHGSPMEFTHPTNKNSRGSLMGYRKQFSPTGVQEIPPISPVHRLGHLRFADARNSINWLTPDRTPLSTDTTDNTEFKVKALTGLDLGDDIPVARIPADALDGHSPVDFVFAGDHDEWHETDRFDNESVRVYRVRDSNATRYYGPTNQAEKGVSVGFGSSLQLEYQTTHEAGTGDDYQATVDVELDTLPANTNTVMLNDHVSAPTNFLDTAGEFNYTTPDLDLVAIDSQGRRVGVTDDGDYVNEIPGATASGDTNGLEWISVPEAVDVRFNVRSDDVEAFLDQTNMSADDISIDYETAVTHLNDNPEIVQEDDTYTVRNATTEQTTTTQRVDPGTTAPAVNDAVIAGFTTIPRYPHPNRSVTFDGSLSSTLNGTIDQYTWTFENGSTTTGETISQTYTQAGTYTLSLQVTDTNGHTDSTSKTFRVADRPPTAHLESPTTDATAGQTDVVLSAANSTDYIGITEFRWDTDGDDSIERITTNATPAITHTYDNPGTYTPTVTAVDTKGQTDTATHTITVDTQPDRDDPPTTPPEDNPTDPPSDTPPSTDDPATTDPTEPTPTEDDTTDTPTDTPATIEVQPSGHDTTFVVANASPNRPVSLTIPNHTQPPSPPANLTKVNLTLAEPAPQFTLTVSPPTPTPPTSTPALDTGSPLSYLTAAPTNLSQSTLTEATIQFQVPSQALPAAATPQDVTLYRYHNDAWHPLPTTAHSPSQYVAETPGFSTFAIATPPTTNTTTTPPQTTTTTAPPTTTTTTSTLTPSTDTTTPPTAPTPTSDGTVPGPGILGALATILSATLIAYRLRV